MAQWENVYAKEFDLNEYLHNLSIHSELLELILKSAESGKKILEAGCGSATLSVFLSYLGFDVTAVDNNKQVLSVAEKNNQFYKGSVEFKYGNLSSLPFDEKEFEVSFSQGVLEHFDKDKIRLLIKEQLRVSRCVIFSVPSVYYRYKQNGDENLWSKAKWEEILSCFNIKISRYYYFQRAKRNLFFNFPLMYMAKV